MENNNNMNGNLNDDSVLGALVFIENQWKGGIVEAVVLTLIAVVIFSVPITVRGSTDITFGIIYKNIRAGLGFAGLWVGGLIIMGNGLASVYGKYLCKNKDLAVYRYYQEDSVLYPLFYLPGSIFALTPVLHYTFPASEGPVAIVSPDIGETVYSIAVDAARIVPVSVIFMLFLLNYGIVDFIGSLTEPLTRPVFKIPGRNVANVIASFVNSASVGALITSKLYQRGIYTKEETALITMGFSTASVESAYKMTETTDFSGYFLPVYLIALLVVLIVSFFMTRTSPLSRKASAFADGRQQTREEIQTGRVPARAVFKADTSRATRKATTAPGLFKEIRPNLLDSCYVLPEAISFLTAMGIIAMLIATYTPVFNQIDKLFTLLLILLQVPNAAETAPVLLVGVAEMSLPVPIIADKVGTLAVGARYMVVTAPMMQIIFFFETTVVITLAKVPVSLKELIICFLRWIIVAMPISVLFMRLLF